MPLPEVTESVFEKKSGGGAIALFGLPFFLAGIGVIVLGFIPREIRGGDEFPLYVAIPFGGIFAAVGAGLIFGRSALTIDRDAGTIVKWWGLLRPMRVKRYQIRDFSQVSLRSEVRRTDKSSYTVYPVRLRGDGDELKLSEERKLHKGRQDAERLAKFLSLPIHDETSGELRIREPDTLDVSIRDRFRDGLESNEIPETPISLKSKIEYDALTLKVVTKPSGFTPVIVIAILGLAMFELFAFGLVLLPIFQDSNSGPDAIFILFAILFGSIPALIIAGIIGKAFLAHDIVTVNSEGMTATRKFIRSKTRHIPADELEELFIQNAGTASGRSGLKLGNFATICARSDETELLFGRGLDLDELNYILALSKAALVS